MLAICQLSCRRVPHSFERSVQFVLGSQRLRDEIVDDKMSDPPLRNNLIELSSYLDCACVNRFGFGQELA